MTLDQNPKLSAELNVAWAYFVSHTGGVIQMFDHETQDLLKCAFQNGYAAGAANEARLNLKRIIEQQSDLTGGVQ